MKRKILLPVFICCLTISTWGDLFSYPIVNFERDKHGCTWHGCNNINKTKTLVQFSDGSYGWDKRITYSGQGWNICPLFILEPGEDPDIYDNHSEMDYLFNYIETQVSTGNLMDTETINIAAQDGTVWAYSVSWDVSDDDPEEADRLYEIERIAQVL